MEMRTQKSTEKREKLLHFLKTNCLGCDLTLSLFISTLNSYRPEKCLRPFPPMFLKDGIKDFDSLNQFCQLLPQLPDLIRHPEKCKFEEVDFLTWLFFENQPVLKIVKQDEIKLPIKINKSFTPQYVFQVIYSERIENDFLRRKGDKEFIWAYHGSSVDNFYSILKFGLQQHFSLEKEVIFGKGIYLSSEIELSANYSQFRKTWDNSLLGNNLSVIAACQIISDCNKIKCRGNGLATMPDKYFVVQDSEMVQIKYLLVYRRKKAPCASYAFENMGLISLLLYIVLLLIIGFVNGTNFWTRILKYVGDMTSLVNK